MSSVDPPGRNERKGGCRPGAASPWQRSCALRAETRRWLFVWLLPIEWSIIAFFSMHHPGDEYALFFVSSMPGAWIVFVIENHGSPWSLFPYVLGTGAITLAIVGLLLDILRASFRLWIVLAVGTAIIVFCTSFGGFPTTARAIAKNGSVEAYVFFALNLGLAFAALLMLPVAGIWRLSHRRPGAGHCTSCGYDLTGNTAGRCPECGVGTADQRA